MVFVFRVCSLGGLWLVLFRFDVGLFDVLVFGYLLYLFTYVAIDLLGFVGLLDYYVLVVYCLLLSLFDFGLTLFDCVCLFYFGVCNSI